MSLQKAVLKQYKEVYPSDKLKEISLRTGIQITRVFRLLNGSEMKLKEYEIFDNLIHKEINSSEFIKISRECLVKLTKNRRESLLFLMKRSLKLADFYNNSTSIQQISCMA